MPEHFTSRTDMINWLIANCPRPSIVRALKANRVEFLGGFTKIPPSNLPGWIFKVGLLNRVKYIVVLCNDLQHKYEVRMVKHVPWESWDGCWCGSETKSRFWSIGDNPLKYLELKNAKNCKRQINNR